MLLSFIKRLSNSMWSTDGKMSASVGLTQAPKPGCGCNLISAYWLRDRGTSSCKHGQMKGKYLIVALFLCFRHKVSQKENPTRYTPYQNLFPTGFMCRNSWSDSSAVFGVLSAHIKRIQLSCLKVKWNGRCQIRKQAKKHDGRVLLGLWDVATKQRAHWTNTFTHLHQNGKSPKRDIDRKLAA